MKLETTARMSQFGVALRNEQTRLTFDEAEVARLEVYLASFGLKDEDQIASVRERVIEETRWIAQVCRGRLRHQSLVVTAERMIADWVAASLDEPPKDDHLLVLRLWVALGAIGNAWDRSEFLSPTPSPAFLNAVKSALPASTPPEQPAPMLSAAYECWKMTELIASLREEMDAVWRFGKAKLAFPNVFNRADRRRVATAFPAHQHAEIAAEDDRARITVAKNTVGDQDGLEQASLAPSRSLTKERAHAPAMRQKVAA